jgi:type II secretion system protein J
MSNERLTSDAGLTLVEALVSLLVFSLVSAGAVLLLTQSVSAQRQIREAQAELRDVQMTQALLAADLAQIVDRRVRGPDNGFAPSFSGGGDALMRFVRADPDHGGLAAIEYSVRDGALVRRMVRDVNSVKGETSDERVLLADVSDVQISFSDGNRTHSSWARPGGGAPRVVTVSFTSPRYGAMRIDALVNPS